MTDKERFDMVYCVLVVLAVGLFAGASFAVWILR